MSVEEFAGLEFAVGSVTGTRSFMVDRLGRLTGIHYQQVWLPGENESECRKREDSFFSGGLISTVQMDSYTSLRQALSTYSYPVVTSTAAPDTRFIPSVPPPRSSKKRTRNVVMVPAPVPAPPAPKREPEHNLETCKCGFYGYYDGSDDYHREGYVSAVVEGYGETLIGTRGFRSVKSKILALHIPTGVPAHLARLVARNYPEIPRFDSFEGMVEMFPTDAGVKALSPDTDPDFWTRSA